MWQGKQAAITATVDYQDDRFRPAQRNRWLAYIKKAYLAGVVAHMGQNEFIDDTEVAGAGSA